MFSWALRCTNLRLLYLQNISVFAALEKGDHLFNGEHCSRRAALHHWYFSPTTLSDSTMNQSVRQKIHFIVPIFKINYIIHLASWSSSAHRWAPGWRKLCWTCQEAPQKWNQQFASGQAQSTETLLSSTDFLPHFLCLLGSDFPA